MARTSRKSANSGETLLPSNADLARASAMEGLLKGNNALVRYAPYILFFHIAVGWSYRRLAQDLTVKLKCHLGGRPVGFRQIETIVTKFKSGKLHIEDAAIEEITSSDPVLATYMEGWRNRKVPTTRKFRAETPSQKSSAPPKPKRANQHASNELENLSASEGEIPWPESKIELPELAEIAKREGFRLQDNGEIDLKSVPAPIGEPPDSRIYRQFLLAVSLQKGWRKTEDRHSYTVRDQILKNAQRLIKDAVIAEKRNK